MTNKEKNKPENFSFSDNSDRKYFSMMPHAIYEIGLTGNEIAVYGAIKRSAGEVSNCTKSKSNLAKNAGVCSKTIFTIIQKLCSVNKFLKKPLIICHSRSTGKGTSDTNLIEIVDIWNEATLLIEEKFKQVNVTPYQVMVTLPPGNGYLPPQVMVTYKEEQHKNNPYEEEQQQSPIKLENPKPISVDVVVFSCLEKLHEQEVPRKYKIQISKKYSEEIVKNAVEVITDPEFKAKDSILKSLNAACRDQWKPSPKKIMEQIKEKEKEEEVKKIYEENKNIFKKQEIVRDKNMEMNKKLLEDYFNKKFEHAEFHPIDEDGFKEIYLKNGKIQATYPMTYQVSHREMKKHLDWVVSGRN